MVCKCFGRTPLWYYVLREADVQAEGRHLGAVGSRLVAETLLGSLKRDPDSYLNSRHPAIGEAGIETDDRGFVETDDRTRSAVDHIHAVGDVAGEGVGEFPAVVEMCGGIVFDGGFDAVEDAADAPILADPIEGDIVGV